MSPLGLLRHRMLTIVLLGVLTSAVSLVVLWRALTLTDRQRLERARDAVTAELQRLSRLPATPESLRRPATTTYVGLHAGWGSTQLDTAPHEWRATIEATLAESHANASLARHETRLPAGVLLVAAAPTAAGLDGAAPTTVWVAVQLAPSAYLQPWRWLVVLLAIATALLVVTAIRGAYVFRKNAQALNHSLTALGRDLAAPVPTPTIVELQPIAEGIRSLVAALDEARASEARLSHELAHKERLAALGRVAAGVAHEVRNPLAAIKLRLDLTAQSTTLPADARAAITAATAEIVRLDRLVNDLLLVAGKQAGPRRPIALGSLVRARAEALAPWSQSRQVAIVVDGDGDALADPESVSRAVDNVLRNAVEATPSAGQVAVHIAAQPHRIEVVVEDRGPGVEAAHQATLFEPFFTTKADGTGLGLAISRAILRAHGGELTYARSAEVTRFSLSLPRPS